MGDTIGSMRQEGQRAPSFHLPASSGRKVRLSDFGGKPVVLYFYPKDDTPGCTVEAKGFQATLGEFDRAGAVILGISGDSVDSHCRFAEKYVLTFLLLADEEHQAAQAYGVWVEKRRGDKTYWGIQRATFLIDSRGRIARVWPQVKPEGHAQDVLGAVKSLKSG